MDRPQPELGWKIMNEFADRIANHEEQNCFVSDARMLEQGFTTGDLTELQYRTMLWGLLPSYAKVVVRSYGNTLRAA